VGSDGVSSDGVDCRAELIQKVGSKGVFVMAWALMESVLKVWVPMDGVGSDGVISDGVGPNGVGTEGVGSDGVGLDAV
jgi:hypothetical protein